MGQSLEGEANDEYEKHRNMILNIQDSIQKVFVQLVQRPGTCHVLGDQQPSVPAETGDGTDDAAPSCFVSPLQVEVRRRGRISCFETGSVQQTPALAKMAILVVVLGDGP